MVLPLDLPVRGRDGREISEVVVPRGTTVQVNLQASNTNKALWGDDADAWNPMRFVERDFESQVRIGTYSNV